MIVIIKIIVLLKYFKILILLNCKILSFNNINIVIKIVLLFNIIVLIQILMRSSYFKVYI